MSKFALILVDVQKAFLHWEADGLQRNNPDALENISKLLSACRASGVKVFHIRHASTEKDSLLRPEAEGFSPIEVAQELAGETVLTKSVNSSFIGTDLEQQLRDGGFQKLLIAGITTNHCVETTTRMAGNLGFDAHLVEDACYTFARTGPDGVSHSAETIHQMTLSNINEEFAQIVKTEEIIAALPKLAA